MKKYTKLFIFTILTCFLTIISTNAKQVNLDELGKEIDKVASNASSAYIIGDYVFTSQHNLTTQDLMLAARSISLNAEDGLINTTPSYGKMTIQRIVRKYDDNADPIGWKVKANALGTAELKLSNTDKINIKYIDYNLVKEESEFTVDINKALEDSPYSTNLKSTFGITDLKKLGENFDIDNDGKLTGLLLKYNEESFKNFAAEARTGYYLPFVIEIPNATNATTLTIKGTNTTNVEFSSFDKNSGADTGVAVLWAINPKTVDKKIIITVDFDGSGDEYEATEYVIDYSQLKFQEDTPYSVKLGNIAEADQTTFTTWGYDSTKNSIEFKDGKLTGKLVEQELISDEAFGASNRKGYYFDFTLVLGADPSKAKVEQVNDKNGSSVVKTFKESEFDENGNITFLRRIANDPKCSNNAESCKVYIRIDLDGSGNEYLPVIYELDYSGLTFEKSSFSKIEKEDNGKLKEVFGWEAKTDKGYNVSITQDTSNHSLYHVNGLLPIYEDNEFNSGHSVPFGEGHNTKYYFGYKLTTTEGKKNESTTVTIESAYEKDETITAGASNFDDDNNLNILTHIHPEATTKTITITIDLDGSGEEYAPYTITLDYSGLKYQTVSTTTVSKDLNEESQTEFDSWGYNSEANETLTYTNEAGNVTKVSGKLIEQELSDTPFGATKKDGYYFTFAFIKPEGVESVENAKIYRLKNKPTDLTKLPTNGEIQKTFDKNEFDEDGTLTILYRFAPETSKCETSGNNDNCKLYYVVDYDGEGQEYLPALYVIDYSGLTFEKSSIFTIEALTSADEDDFADGSFLTKDGYYTEITQVDGNPLHYKVTGVLPIFTDEEWEDNNDPLNSTDGNFYYYLGLRLKLANKLSSGEEIPKASDIIKFLHGDKEDELFQSNIQAGDLNEAGELNILKYVLPTDENKTFTITVDLDGPEKDEFAPYTVTIDYSELKFQSESFESEFGLLQSSELSDGTPEKEELDKYGFKNETVSEVELKENEEQPDSHYIEGIKGTIKEQTLDDGFNENTGYFVPIKISVPKDEDWFADYINSWELILNTESNGTKIYKPTPEEYAQGWVMVLFKITKDGKNGVKSIKYSIDYDGSSNKDAHTGDAFLPYEYEIKYDDLQFKSEEPITYHYVDSNGNEQTVTVEAYEGDTVIPQSMEEQNTPYRTFTKWTDDEGNDVTNGFKIEADKEVNLTAHWTLDADAFMDAFITDLNNPDSEISQDYSSMFSVAKDGNEITFDVKDATMKLDAMDNTTIPSALAYILQKGEIKEITITTNFPGKTNKKLVLNSEASNSPEAVVLSSIALSPEATTLKSNIQTKVKELFDSVLGEDATNMTLNKMAVAQNSYTIAIGQTVENAELKDSDNTYTIKFTTNATAVTSEEELQAALANKDIESITIANSFDVSTTQTINRKVTISSASDNTYTITAKEGATTGGIFKVTYAGANINNLKLTSANTAIIVETAGSLTIDKVDLSNNTEAGIEVKGNGSVTATELTMTNETYDIPAVRAEKSGSATIRLTDSTEHPAGKVTKEKITKAVESSITDTKVTDDSYTYYNYYNNPANGKIYVTKFFTYEGPYRLEFTRYSHYNETIAEPTTEPFKKFNYDGHDYNILGYASTPGRSVAPKDATSDCEKSGDIIAPSELKATSDAHYFAAYCVKLQAGTEEVDSKEGLDAALAKTETKAIYIKAGTTIDYGDAALNITRKVSIVGRDKTATIKAKEINITASEVFLQRLKLEIKASQSQDALIKVSDSSADKVKFTAWQLEISNVGEKATSAIKVTDDKEVVIDVRWSNFAATNLDNYIYADGPLGEGTEIYLNTFNALTNPSESSVKNSAIIIKSFADDAVEIDGETDINLSGNTYKGNNDNYAIKILKDASGKKADINLGYSKDLTLAAEYDDNNKNFSNIKYIVKTLSFKSAYIKDNEVSETPPQGVEAFKIQIASAAVTD